MAEALKQATEILTLKATVLSRESPLQIELSLERFRSGRNVLENVWQVSAQELGVPSAIAQVGDAPLTLPEAVLRPLIDAVDRAANDHGWREPLWLHFVKPYGVVGALDWESQLSTALSRPVFRLPDFLEVVRVHPSRMEAVIICDLPTDEPVFDVPGQMHALVETLAEGLHSWPTKFNLFVPERWRTDVERALADQYEVVIHTSPGRPVRWLDWVSESLAGQRVDWVQFLVHADATEMTPSLAFTGGPGVGESRITSDFISPSEVALCLNRLSVWGCGFASPPGSSAAALRYFADATAQARPGPVLFENLEAPDWRSTLPARLECLFFPDPGRLRIDPNPGGFLYVQPERLGVMIGADRSPAPHDPASGEPGVVAAPEPAWVVSANTFITTARQEWGLSTALGSLSAPASLIEPDVWTANAVGAFEQVSPMMGSKLVVSAAEDTLKALSNLTSAAIFSKGEDE